MTSTVAPSVQVVPLRAALLDGTIDAVDGPLELPPRARAAMDVALVPVFADERPLRGLAAHIDWRACGELSALLRCGYARGDSDERVLMPAPRQLPWGRLVLLGLGPRTTWSPERAGAHGSAARELLAGLAPFEHALVAAPDGALDRAAVEAFVAALASAGPRTSGARTAEPSPSGRAHAGVVSGGFGDGSSDSLRGKPWVGAVWVVADEQHVPRLRRRLQGPPRAATSSG